MQNTEQVNEKDLDTYELELLKQFFREYILERKAFILSPSCSRIHYSDLLYLFSPLDFVIGSSGQVYQIMAISFSNHNNASPYLSTVNDKRDGVKITAVYIDFDGTNFGPVTETFKIPEFHNEVSVTSLPVYPLRFYSTSSSHNDGLWSSSGANSIATSSQTEKGLRELRSSLVKRGKLFIRSANVAHLFYSGVDLRTMDTIESQVMVDFKQAFTHGDPAWKPSIEVESKVEDDSSWACGSECRKGCTNGDRIVVNQPIDTAWKEHVLEAITKAETSRKRHRLPLSMFAYPISGVVGPETPISDDEYLIMSRRVFGFSLRDRKWGEFPEIPRAQGCNKKLTHSSLARHGQLVPHLAVQAPTRLQEQQWTRGDKHL